MDCVQHLDNVSNSLFAQTILDTDNRYRHCTCSIVKKGKSNQGRYSNCCLYLYKVNLSCHRTYVGAAIKLPALVKMTNLTLCPWGSKSKKTTTLAGMEQSFPEMAVKETQAVFQVYQSLHQWTQPSTHPLTPQSGITFAFPTSVGEGLNSLMQRPEQPSSRRGGQQNRM